MEMKHHDECMHGHGGNRCIEQSPMKAVITDYRPEKDATGLTK